MNCLCSIEAYLMPFAEDGWIWVPISLATPCPISLHNYGRQNLSLWFTIWKLELGAFNAWETKEKASQITFPNLLQSLVRLSLSLSIFIFSFSKVQPKATPHPSGPRLQPVVLKHRSVTFVHKWSTSSLSNISFWDDSPNFMKVFDHASSQKLVFSFSL